MTYSYLNSHGKIFKGIDRTLKPKRHSLILRRVTAGQRHPASMCTGSNEASEKRLVSDKPSEIITRSQMAADPAQILHLPLSGPAVVNIPLKNSWIRIVIWIGTKIERFIATGHPHPFKNFIRIHRQLRSRVISKILTGKFPQT